tara:strand:- start:283 stop:486 length:204 start_codon:yes stop_codon:yes gene_type:complete
LFLSQEVNASLSHDWLGFAAIVQLQLGFVSKGPKICPKGLSNPKDPKLFAQVVAKFWLVRLNKFNLK